MEPSTSHSGPLAGPSSHPPLVFPPPQPLPYPKQHLHSTQDLLAVFNLIPAYDKYVRPHVRPIGDPPDIGKGKGKEREVPAGDAAGHDREGEDDEGGDKKKKKDSYRHLIKRTPGKHSMKKDSYFQNLIAAPPKQKMQIQPIDAKTLREGFSVSVTGLPSYNKTVLEGTDPKEKEAKRLKKERRKAEKERLRQQQEQAQGSASSASTPAAVSTPRAVATPGSTASHARNVSAGTPVPKGRPPIARAPSSRPGTPKVAAASAQQRTTSTPVPPHQAGGPGATGRVASTPVPAGGRPAQVNGIGNGNVNMVEKRGIKRELDVQQPLTPGAQPGSTNANAPAPAQQRPQKKRRIGSSTPQPSPMQQPTPHGS